MRKRVNIKSVGLIIVILYVGALFISQRINMYKINKQISEQQTQLKNLEEKNQALQDEVDISKTDKYIEKLARQRLGLVKQNETTVIQKTNSEN